MDECLEISKLKISNLFNCLLDLFYFFIRTMTVSLMVILAFAVTICYLNGQQYEQTQQQQQQQSTTLTRENVEALLTVLSDACRAEMEAALNTQSDISVDCKEEIQGALVSLNIPLGQQPPQNQQEEFQQQPRKEKQEKKNSGESGRSSAPIIPPIYSVLGFVLVFFGGIAGLVFYVSNQRSTYFSKKPKKISKKKVIQPYLLNYCRFNFSKQEEKLRQKSQAGAVKIQ